MKKIFYIYNYFIYRLKAVNEHGVHSPFVFDLLTNVIYNKNEYYSFKKIEKVREELLRSKKIIKISKIVKSHTLPTKYSQLLFRLVNHFMPPQIMEFGTSFGISTAYMASANSKNSIITIEKEQEITEIAKQNFKQLGLKNIEQKTGNVDDILKTIMANNQNLFFICFDGDHCKQDVLNYFYLCVEKATEESVFVFENMYLSPELKKAWEEIKNDNRVTVTLDLFFIGIVFFRKTQVKQHFVIEF
ncbi:MAG: class I SAM-dependent methyltransferase [Bacteroidetes bacterium]|nr:class I SAM-dependent methyltransferase [Bacteroidota bacterium]